MGEEGSQEDQNPPTKVCKTMTPGYSVIRGAEFDPNLASITPFSMSVEGLEGTGKTHFGLMTCPTPVVHVNFGDRDATNFLYSMSEERRKLITLYSLQPETHNGWTREECQASLHQLSKVAQDDLSDGKLKGGTFVLDSGSSWWRNVREVYVAPKLEKQAAASQKKTGGLEYDQGNLIVSGVFTWIARQGCFLVVTHQKAQDWDNQGPIPGKYRPQINSKVPSLVDVRLDFRIECSTCGGAECQAKGHVGRNHIGRIIKLGGSTAFVGLDLPGASFKDIYKLQVGRDFPNEEALR